MSKAFEHYAPTAVPDIQADLSSARLLHDMRSFAFNNRAFKDGLVDEVLIRIMSTDAQDPELPMEDEISAGYVFEAIRNRPENDPADDRKPRTELIFEISAVAIKDYVTLPEYIAIEEREHEDGTTSVVPMVGSIERQKRCTITSLSKTVLTCEGVTFRDPIGEVVAQECTCPKTDAEGDIITEMTVEHDELILGAEEASEFWMKYYELEAGLEEEMVFEAEDKDLVEAHRAFAMFKQALRQQLGL